MSGLSKLKRSWFYTPASKSEWFEGALSRGADVIVLDLEDAVPSTKQKVQARHNISDLRDEGYLEHIVAVRINALDTNYFSEDLACVLERQDIIDYVVVPKITSRDGLLSVQQMFSDTSITLVPIIELLQAELNISEIASVAGEIEFLQWGETGDYSTDWGSELMKNLDAMHDFPALQFALTVLKAGKIFGKAVLDGAHLDYENTATLHERVTWAKRMGFSGKAALHPLQIPIINEAFTPKYAELLMAEEIVATFEDRVLGADFPTVVPYKSSFISQPQYKLAKKFLARYAELKDLIKSQVF